MTRLLMILSLFSTTAWAQHPHQVMFTLGYSQSQPMYNKPVDGGLSFHGNGTLSVGVRYLMKTRSALALETGIELSQHRFTATANLPPNVHFEPSKEKAYLVSVPVYANLTFLKHFFFHCGPILDVEINKDNSIHKQSGIGLGAGLGGRLPIGKLTLSLNPFLQRHALLPFDGNQGTEQSLINGGARVGLIYPL